MAQVALAVFSLTLSPAHRSSQSRSVRPFVLRAPSWSPYSAGGPTSASCAQKTSFKRVVCRRHCDHSRSKDDSENSSTDESSKALAGGGWEQTKKIMPASLPSTHTYRHFPWRRGYPDEVVNPGKNRRMETFSYVPKDTLYDLLTQINNILYTEAVIFLEYQTNPTISRTNSRLPGYYDGRYWNMWKRPFFGECSAEVILEEIATCHRVNSDAHVRLVAIDTRTQVQITSFVVAWPAQTDE
ncbi:hypothetical protein AAMO2058_000238600 [Amorphochlora amoebiformis]